MNRATSRHCCPVCCCDVKLIRGLNSQQDLYACTAKDCAGSMLVSNYSYFFTTRAKHSLNFIKQEIELTKFYPRCQKCEGTLSSTYFGWQNWLVCENSETCCTYFVESSANVYLYQTYGKLGMEHGDYRLIRTTKVNSRAVDKIKYNRLSWRMRDFEEEFSQLQKELYLVGIKTSSKNAHWEWAFTPFLRNVLYFTNFNVPAALRLFLCKTNYGDSHLSVAKICRSKPGVSYLTKHLEEACDNINLH